MIYIYLRGLFIGGFVHNFAVYLDFSLCKETYNNYSSKEIQLYLKGTNKCFNNLVLIAPIFYVVNNTYFIDQTVYYFQPLNAITILLGHNIFYYLAHMAMHKVSFIRFIHEFHHQFEKNLLPSIGNAVSEYEFLFAYLLPFVLMCNYLQPSQITLDFSIAVIAGLNMFIHSDLLYNLPYSRYFVSPKNHIDHHKVQYKHYAAPLVNIDNLLTSNK